MDEADIEALKIMLEIVTQHSIIYKDFSNTDTLIYLQCLTELGLLRQGRDTAHIYWELA